MRLLDINPFLRYAELQPSVLSSVPFCQAYDYRLFMCWKAVQNLCWQTDPFPSVRAH